jgi:hypothetical protein
VGEISNYKIAILDACGKNRKEIKLPGEEIEIDL